MSNITTSNITGLLSTVDANSLLSTGYTTTGIINTNISNSLSWYNFPNKFDPDPNITMNGRLIHDLGDDGITYQHEVAVLQVTRNEEGQIIRSKMIKTMWVETLNQGSIDYAVSKDSEASKLNPNEIIIKTLRTIKL